MNIWTISLFDPTPYDKVGDHRFIQVAKIAKRKGYRTTHFTSTFRHTSKKQRFSESTTIEEEYGYKVVYVRSKGYKRNLSVGRLLAHRDFAHKLLAAFDGRNKPDLIFISMPPLNSAEYVVQWGASHGVPVITDIIDPWPDSFIKDIPNFLKPVARLALTPFYNKLRFILENSAVITSISNGYLEWAENKSQNIRRTECFYPAFDLQAIQKAIQQHRAAESRDKDILRVIYVGSLGSSYDLPTIVKAAEIMQEKHPDRTEFVVAGVGPQKDLVEKYAQRLENLSYLGWISEDELMRQYAISDLGLIQHKNNMTQTVTYKLFSYLSASLPILNSLQSEMARIIRDNNVGLNNDNGDAAGLVQNLERFLRDRDLLSQYQKNALVLARTKGDAAAVYGRMLELFEEVSESNIMSVKIDKMTTLRR